MTELCLTIHTANNNGLDDILNYLLLIHGVRCVKNKFFQNL
jgi:hypothetical protein